MRMRITKINKLYVVSYIRIKPLEGWGRDTGECTKYSRSGWAYKNFKM